MHAETAAEITAERRQAKINAIEDAITQMQINAEYAVDWQMDELVRLGVFPSLWGSGVERNALCRRVAKLVIAAVLKDDACDLPDEVRHLYREELA